MKTETAERAAAWWANQLRGNAKLDHGDDSNTGLLTIMLATILQEQEARQREGSAVDRFERELMKAIIEEEPWCISVDYHPDQLLTKAAEKSGINLGMASLPWKTNMWIEDDTIRVSCGYRAPAIEF